MQHQTTQSDVNVANSCYKREYIDAERRTVKLNESDWEFLKHSIVRNIDVFNRLRDK